MRGRSVKNADLGQSLNDQPHSVETITQLDPVPPVQLPAQSSQPDRYNNVFVRFQWERGNAMCSLEEPRRAVLSVERTFAPSPQLLVLQVRIAFLTLSGTALYFDIANYPSESRSMYCGYFSVWVFILSILYQICSFLCSMRGPFTKQPMREQNGYLLLSPGLLVHMTWILYSLTVNLGLLNALFFWSVLLDNWAVSTNLSIFTTLAFNGGVLLLIIIDGSIIGKIPIRVNHIAIVWLVTCLYMVWLGLQEVFGLYGDDAIYEQVQWRGDPYKTYFYCTIVLFVFLPMQFFIIWFLSFSAAGFRFNGTGYRLYERRRECGDACTGSASTSSSSRASEEVIHVQRISKHPSDSSMSTVKAKTRGRVIQEQKSSYRTQSVHGGSDIDRNDDSGTVHSGACSSVHSSAHAGDTVFPMPRSVANDILPLANLHEYVENLDATKGSLV